MSDLVITQVRSANGTSPRQRATLGSLRLGRIGRSVTRSDSPELRGMLTVVGHLVEVTAGEAASGGKSSGADS
jgi:large subunit ribosomal protein L30